MLPSFSVPGIVSRAVRSSRLLFLSALMTLLPSLAVAAPADDLAKLLAAANTVEADFLQTMSSGGGQAAQSSRGHMQVSRPQLFRWDVKEPFTQLIVADGKQVWLYDPDLAQAVVKPFDRQLADTPALLFSGDAQKIGERYDVTQVDAAPGAQRFELNPRDPNALFESLGIVFRKGKLAEMSLFDSLGQTTRIVFNNVKTNGKIPADRFRFTPPAGTDVIREGD